MLVSQRWIGFVRWQIRGIVLMYLNLAMWGYVHHSVLMTSLSVSPQNRSPRLGFLPKCAAAVAGFPGVFLFSPEVYRWQMPFPLGPGSWVTFRNAFAWGSGLSYLYRVALGEKKRDALKLRLPDGVCLHCGYDLRATPDRCPECGMVPDKVTA
jgi:hypothetical protein